MEDEVLEFFGYSEEEIKWREPRIWPNFVASLNFAFSSEWGKWESASFSRQSNFEFGNEGVL